MASFLFFICSLFFCFIYSLFFCKLITDFFIPNLSLSLTKQSLCCAGNHSLRPQSSDTTQSSATAPPFHASQFFSSPLLTHHTQLPSIAAEPGQLELLSSSFLSLHHTSSAIFRAPHILTITAPSSNSPFSTLARSQLISLPLVHCGIGPSWATLSFLKPSPLTHCNLEPRQPPSAIPIAVDPKLEPKPHLLSTSIPLPSHQKLRTAHPWPLRQFPSPTINPKPSPARISPRRRYHPISAALLPRARAQAVLSLSAGMKEIKERNEEQRKKERCEEMKGNKMRRWRRWWWERRKEENWTNRREKERKKKWEEENWRKRNEEERRKR